MPAGGNISELHLEIYTLAVMEYADGSHSGNYKLGVKLV